MQPADENGLLAVLPPAVYQRLIPALKRVRLDAGDILYDAGDAVDHAWFVTGGIVSLLSVTEDGDTIEATMIGREGVIGFPGIRRSNGTAFRARVQVAGEALRVKATSMRTAAGQGSEFYELLLHYTHSLNELIAQGAVCNRFHTREQSLARWLLLARDRTLCDSFLLTHETVAQILGVSRSGVSSAAGVLQMKGVIRYARGRITVLNRKGLEASVCECCKIVTQTINSYLPSSHPSEIDRVQL
ncbi:MAG: Crp/Fnr family transcriptional regulator [Blastocatellia bacterium]